MAKEIKLSGGIVSLVGLGKEYCEKMESAFESTGNDMARDMLRYLPRLYMLIDELRLSFGDEEGEDTGAIYPRLEEDQYDSVRLNLAALFGEYDTYLDASVEDMRYSDTPLAASISEQLADIYQELYNFTDTVRDAGSESLEEILSNLKYDFEEHLSNTICSALRAINYVYRQKVLE